MTSSSCESKGPLAGVRVLELGQLIAGPFAGSYLANFGARVIKIEPPGKGDPLRGWRSLKDGTSWWWYSLARNKESVALDLKSEQGRDVLKRLISQVDVVIENFRPGVLESWGLGPEELKRLNPKLVLARVSGYGQTGPMREKPGFASVCEGFSGFRYLNGFPGEVPVRPNLSIGDSIAGLFAVTGILMALQRGEERQFEVVDVALYESMFSLLEAVMPEYLGTGEIRRPSGTTLTGIVPTNTYTCADGKYLIVGGNGDSIFVRLMQAIGRDDLASDPGLAHNAGRVEQESRIDAAIRNWCGQHGIDECLEILEQARVPAGPVYDAADIAKDAQYRARQMIRELPLASEKGVEKIAIPAYAPKMQESGETELRVGPELGQHTNQVLCELGGLDDEQLAVLKDEGVI